MKLEKQLCIFMTTKIPIFFPIINEIQLWIECLLFTHQHDSFVNHLYIGIGNQLCAFHQLTCSRAHTHVIRLGRFWAHFIARY